MREKCEKLECVNLNFAKLKQQIDGRVIMDEQHDVSFFRLCFR